MNKLIIVGLVVLVIFSAALFAALNVQSEKPDRRDSSQTIEPEMPVEPLPDMQTTYKGMIEEINEGSILTTGVEGIEGSVVVHLPDNYDSALIFEAGMILHVRYDGRIAESYPMQIWATEVIAVESSQIPIPDLPEEPKRPPLSPEAVRFTVENTIRSIHKGEIFEIVLEVNPTTGYRTELSFPDNLTLLSDVYISQSKSSALVGSGSIRILQFTSDTSGTYEITCDAVAPSGDTAHTYSIGVEITQ